MSDFNFIFVKLDDDNEGKRINRLGRPKRAYLGKHCRQVGVYPPYAMQFEDGAVWALDIEQIEPVKPYYRIIAPRYNLPVICVETGQEFMNARDAGVSVGLVKGAINTAINSGCKAGGYHWIRKGQEEPPTVADATRHFGRPRSTINRWFEASENLEKDDEKRLIYILD